MFNSIFVAFFVSFGMNVSFVGFPSLQVIVPSLILSPETLIFTVEPLDIVFTALLLGLHSNVTFVTFDSSSLSLV